MHTIISTAISLLSAIVVQIIWQQPALTIIAVTVLAFVALYLTVTTEKEVTKSTKLDVH